MNIQEQAEEFGVKYSYTVKMAFPAHKIAFNACLMRAFKDGYLAALAAKEQAKPEDDLVHYQRIRDFANAKARYISENIGAGEQLNYQQVFNKIESSILECYNMCMTRHQSYAEEKAKEESIAFAEWMGKKGYKFETNGVSKIKMWFRPYPNDNDGKTTSELFNIYQEYLKSIK